jgi:hypothetical protein
MSPFISKKTRLEIEVKNVKKKYQLIISEKFILKNLGCQKKLGDTFVLLNL